MAGDVVSMFGKSYWKTTDGNVPGSPEQIVLLDLLKDFAGSATGMKSGISGEALNDLTDLVSGMNGLLNTQSQTSTKPKAYLNWVLFDENFRPVIGSTHTNSGFDQVGMSNELKSHIKSTGEISKNGYLYIYCSNESQLPVFFDNLQVVHTRGPLLEETHYYPFGLTMAGISSKALNFGQPENKKGYNGNELQNKEFGDLSGLEWYDFNARTYDPQIGSFIQVDPLIEAGEQETLTPYHFAKNNPIKYNDPDGKCPSCIIGLIVGAAVEYGTQVVVNLKDGKSFGDAMTDVKLVDIGIAAAAGALTGGASSFVPKGTAGKIVKGGIEMAIDAGQSMYDQYRENGNVTFSETFTDVMLSKASGELTSNVKLNSDDAVNTTKHQLDRAERISANDPKSSGRRAKVDQLQDKLKNQNMGNQGASGVAGGSTSAILDPLAGNVSGKPAPLVLDNKKIIDNVAPNKYIPQIKIIPR